MLGSGLYQLAAAEPNTTGQTGLINMPDARMDEDGRLRFGASYFRPYVPIWASISMLPRLELSGRYTIIRGLSSDLGQGFIGIDNPIFRQDGQPLERMVDQGL